MQQTETNWQQNENNTSLKSDPLESIKKLRFQISLDQKMEQTQTTRRGPVM